MIRKLYKLSVFFILAELFLQTLLHEMLFELAYKIKKKSFTRKYSCSSHFTCRDLPDGLYGIVKRKSDPSPGFETSHILPPRSST